MSRVHQITGALHAFLASGDATIDEVLSATAIVSVSHFHVQDGSRIPYAAILTEARFQKALADLNTEQLDQCEQASFS